MTCEKCGGQTKVTLSEANPTNTQKVRLALIRQADALGTQYIIRYRKCLTCANTWPTLEVRLDYLVKETP